MSKVSHACKFLCKQYRLVLRHMNAVGWLLEHGKKWAASEQPGPMTVAFEPFEPRVLLSAEPGMAYPTVIFQPDSLGNSPPSGSFTPAQICSAYGFDQVSFGSAAGDGSGQTVAIIDAYDDPAAMNDLNYFSTQFSLPQFNVSGGPTFSQVGQSGGAVPGTDPAGPNNGTTWEVEESQDIEWVHAIAPRANIMLVEAGSASESDLSQAAAWAADQPGVVVVSMSFSGPEYYGQLNTDFAFITQFGHPSVTFLAASGDYGQPAGFPACSPNVVSVGGTSLTLAPDGSTYQSETGWSRGGGGISLYEAQPPYQTGVVTQSTTMRTAPDVAMDADGATGVACYDSYDDPGAPWRNVAGTSLSTVMWAGLIAAVDQGRALAGLDSLNGRYQTLPGLYKLPAADFNDITSGNNGYSAGTGYDLVTGLGSPVANRLIPDMVTIGQPSKLCFSAQPTSTAAGAEIDQWNGVQVSVEDSLDMPTEDTSSVTITLNGGTFGTGGDTVTVQAQGGVATFNNLVIDATGNYTLTASDGDLTVAASQSFPVFGDPSKLSFTQEPTLNPAGEPINPAVTVAVLDQNGNMVLTDSSTVTLTLSGGTFAGGGTTASATAQNGVATFNNLVIDSPGNYTLWAADATLTGAATSTFTLAPPASVLSIDRESPAGSGSEGTSVTYEVTFSEPVTGVTSADFQLAFTGRTTASSTFAISPNNGYNTVYDVTVNSISGKGTLRLVLVDNSNIVNEYGFQLANPNGTMEPQQTYATGAAPSSVAAADLNGDGKPDLIVANSSDDTVGVLLGNGDGTFQNQETYSVGSNPTSVAVADVNGDGKPDLIVANSSDGTVGVLLGNGDGTFQAQQTYATGENSSPRFVAVADLNGDGKQDIVVADYSSNEVGILLGNGNGTFQAQQTFTVGTGPQALALGDINGDGKLDLVTGNNGRSVSVLLGNGDGTFQAAHSTFTGGFRPCSVALADLNGDGKLDMTFASLGSKVFVMLGNGDGTFQTWTTYPVGSSSYSVSVADINFDGKLDLVVANLNSNNVSLLLGNGNGTFQPQQTFAAGAGPYSLALTDVNGDGTPNLVVANNSDNTVSVILNGYSFPGQVYTVDQPTNLVITRQPADTTAGCDINGSNGVQVAVEDSGGGTVGIDSSVVTLTLNGGTFAGGGNTVTATAVNGVASFGNLVIDAAGDYTLSAGDGALTGATADDGTLTGATSSSFAVGAAAAAQLVFTQEPAYAMAGAAFGTAVTVVVQDQFGNTVATDNSTVTLTLSSGTFAGGGTTVTTSASGGVATFSNLVITAAGSYSLAAGDGSLTGATSGSIAIYLLPDFNSDGLINATDIDLLYQNLTARTGTYNASFDVNGDGVVDQNDLDAVVKVILHTAYGDANLDGQVNVDNFSIVLSNWGANNGLGYSDTTVGWAQGDFSGDGRVGIDDFSIFLSNWGFSG